MWNLNILNSMLPIPKKAMQPKLHMQLFSNKIEKTKKKMYVYLHAIIVNVTLSM